MDGQRGPDGTEALFPHAVVFEVDGHQSGLPVVAVNDVGPELHVVQHPDNGPGEKAEPLAVVHVAVQVRAVEVLLVVQEVPDHAILFQGKQAAVHMAPGQVHIVIAQKGQLIAKPLPDAAVQRHHHRYLRPLRGQGGRQGTGHVSQSSGFTKRDGLAGCIQNFHV